MPELTLIEAINSARQMANFFKAFKKIEEVVNVAAMLEQNIKELESRREKLIPEIESLIEKKELAEKNFTKVLEEMKVKFEDTKIELDSELKIVRDEFEKEKESLFLEIEAIKVAKMNALVEHEEAMVQIKTEKDETEKTLIKVKDELEGIKIRLN